MLLDATLTGCLKNNRNYVIFDRLPVERLGSYVVARLVTEAEDSCECRLRNSEEAELANNLSLPRCERKGGRGTMYTVVDTAVCIAFMRRLRF